MDYKKFYNTHTPSLHESYNDMLYDKLMQLPSYKYFNNVMRKWHMDYVVCILNLFFIIGSTIFLIRNWNNTMMSWCIVLKIIELIIRVFFQFYGCFNHEKIVIIINFTIHLYFVILNVLYWTYKLNDVIFLFLLFDYIKYTVWFLFLIFSKYCIAYLTNTCNMTDIVMHVTYKSNMFNHSYHTFSVEDDRGLCYFCKQFFNEDDIIKRYNCSSNGTHIINHEYHIDCIKAWMQLSLACPLCYLIKK